MTKVKLLPHKKAPGCESLIQGCSSNVISHHFLNQVVSIFQNMPNMSRLKFATFYILVPWCTLWLAPGPAPCTQRQSWSFKALWSFCSWLWGWGMWQDVTVCGGGIAQRYSSTLLSAVWHLNCAVAIRVAALSAGMWRLVFTSVYIVQSCCAGQFCAKPRVAGGRVKMYEPKRIFISSCAVRRKNMTNVYTVNAVHNQTIADPKHNCCRKSA